MKKLRVVTSWILAVFMTAGMAGSGIPSQAAEYQAASEKAKIVYEAGYGLVPLAGEDEVDIELLSKPITGSGTAIVNQYDPNGASYLEIDLKDYLAGYNTKAKLTEAGITSATITLTASQITSNSTDRKANVQAFFMSDAYVTWNTMGAVDLNQNIETETTVDFSTGWDSGDTLGSFGIQFGNLKEGTPVEYTITSIRLTGSTSGGGQASGPAGDIDTAKEYNFAKLLQYSLYFYDANMCGNLEGTSLQDWRKNCHTKDTFTYNGKTYDVSGGYHDAGDHVKFGLPMAYSATTLGLGYYEFKEAYDELGQTGHLKTILDYFCDYFKKCTVMDTDGTVEAFCYQVGSGEADHAEWTSPENQDSRQANSAYIATASNPATDVVSETAAAFAIHYINFGDAESLKYAKALFAFAQANDKKIGNCETSSSGETFYNSTTWNDDYCLAAALLYMAAQKSGDTTAQQLYKSEYQNNSSDINCGWPLCWDDVRAAACLYAPDGDAAKLNSLDSYLSGQTTDVSKYYCALQWGSARYNTSVQFLGLAYDNHKNTSKYLNWATYQMSVILGNNSTGKNLVCGYNENSPKFPHHRAASGYNGWDEQGSGAPEKHVLLGALVGGPTSTDFSSYEDKISNYTTNEVACDYNAALTGAAAGLYLSYKDSEEDGFSNQTLDENYYHETSGEGDDTVDVTDIQFEEAFSEDEPKELEVGDTFKNTASVIPDDATEKGVIYTSGDEDIATVEDDGTVTAVAEGSTYIQAAAKADGKIYDRYYVKVTDHTVPAVPDIQAALGKINNTEYGYTAAPSTELTISNKGNGDSEKITVSLKKGTGSDFILSDTKEFTVAAGESKELTISLKDGLPAGTYTDTVVIIHAGETTEAEISVTVEKKVITSDMVTFPTKGTDIVCGSKLSESELVGGKSEYGTFSWEDEDTVADQPGEQKFSVKFTLTDPDNYTYDGPVKKDIPVTVVEKEVPVDGIAFEENFAESTPKELKKGASFTNIASVTPSNATKKGVTYTSGNNSIVTVDTDGTVTAVAKGTTYIEAASKADSTITASYYIKVTEPDIQVTTGTLKNTEYGYTTAPSAEITIKNDGDADSNPVTVSMKNGAGSKFKLSVAAAFIVKKGDKKTVTVTLQTGLPAGTYTDTLIIAHGSEKVQKEISVTVSKKEIAESMVIFPTKGTDIELGAKLSSSVLVGGKSDYGTFAWQNGNAVADKEGTISYTVVFTLKDPNNYIYNGPTRKDILVVVKKPAVVAVTGINLNQTQKTMNKRETLKLTAAVAPQNASNQSVTWTSSDPKVAIVSADGTVTAVGTGTVVITARTLDGGKKASCTVTVTVPDVNVFYKTHVQTYGWQDYVLNGAMSGTEGQKKRLEGINIKVTGNDHLGIQYTTHVQTYGWLPWSANDEMSGTEGEAKRLEAIMIQLTGDDAGDYDVYYRVHAQTYGWLNWAKNGAPSGTAEQAKRLEGIEIVVVKKNENPPVRNNTWDNRSFISNSGIIPSIGNADKTNVAYRTHVQTYGWQGYRYNGAMAGTSGEAKRLESIKIKLTNKQYNGGIRYRTHIQSIGWESGWKQEDQLSGTEGQAKRLEAIQIELTGEMAEHYDIYYRVHAQHFGWLDWAKNGESAGTAGYAYRLEGIEIVLVEKGSPAPGSTAVCFREKK